MKSKRKFRIGILLCALVFLPWLAVVPAKAEGTDAVGRQQEESVIQVEDIEGLDAEFAALEEDSVLVVEEVERYRRDARQKTFWRIIVVVLVIGILGIGIATALRENQKKTGSEEKMREKLLEVLAEAKPGFEFEGKTGLVNEGYLDSFDIITLVSELNEKFDIDIPVESILAENFDSVDTILALIEGLLAE